MKFLQIAQNMGTYPTCCSNAYFWDTNVPKNMQWPFFPSFVIFKLSLMSTRGLERYICYNNTACLKTKKCISMKRQHMLVSIKLLKKVVWIQKSSSVQKKPGLISHFHLNGKNDSKSMQWIICALIWSFTEKCVCNRV